MSKSLGRGLGRRQDWAREPDAIRVDFPFEFPVIYVQLFPSLFLSTGSLYMNDQLPDYYEALGVSRSATTEDGTCVSP